MSRRWRRVAASGAADLPRRAARGGPGPAFRFSLRGSRRAPPAGAGRRCRQARRSIGKPATPQGGEPPRQSGVIRGCRSGNRPGRRADRNWARDGASCHRRPSYGRIAGKGRPGGRPFTSVSGLTEGGGRRCLRRERSSRPPVAGRPLPPWAPRCETDRRTSWPHACRGSPRRPPAEPRRLPGLPDWSRPLTAVVTATTTNSPGRTRASADH